MEISNTSDTNKQRGVMANNSLARKVIAKRLLAAIIMVTMIVSLSPFLTAVEAFGAASKSEAKQDAKSDADKDAKDAKSDADKDAKDAKSEAKKSDKAANSKDANSKDANSKDANSKAASSKDASSKDAKSDAKKGAKDAAGQKIYSIDGPRELKLPDSKGASVMEAKSNVFLYNKNGDRKFYPASTTKILTAIIVLEKIKDLNKEATISANAVDGIDPSSSHIALEIGEKVRVIDLLHGLMMASGNDCAVALAEEVAGSVKDFAKLMNKKAEELGAKNSHFVNPHGLFSKYHYSTPNDMAMIMNYCVKNKKFVKLISTVKYIIPRTKKSKKRELWNTHRMLKYMDQYYKGVIGGKTGFIHESGCNLITYAKRGDMELIAVGSGAPFPSDQCKMTKRMFNRYFKFFKIDTIAKDDIKAEPLKLEDKKVMSNVKDDIRIVIPKNADASKVTQDYVFDDIKLPIEKDQKIGKVNCVYNDRIVGTADLYSDSYYPTEFASMMIRIGLISAGAIILIIAIVVMMRRKKKKASQEDSADTESAEADSNESESKEKESEDPDSNKSSSDQTSQDQTGSDQTE